MSTLTKKYKFTKINFIKNFTKINFPFNKKKILLLPKITTISIPPHDTTTSL